MLWCEERLIYASGDVVGCEESRMNIGVISGHVLPGLLKRPELITVETAYGLVFVSVVKTGQHTLFVVNRHGQDSSVPPHRMNARAMIAAFAESHVKAVFAVGTVGSMRKSLSPGDLVVPTDFVDMTRSRPMTFFDESRVHVDMTDPFCPVLREAMVKSAKASKTHLHEKAVVLVTEGPRLETAAEIRLFREHADVVGQTLVPEVVLAREKGMCYASLCLVCNMAAGLQDWLTAAEIAGIYKEREPVVSAVVEGAIERLPASFSCACGSSLAQAKL
jgi:5'-methylthioadenosine phosphorylase